jgi:hypothetical protein
MEEVKILGISRENNIISLLLFPNNINIIKVNKVLYLLLKHIYINEL